MFSRDIFGARAAFGAALAVFAAGVVLLFNADAKSVWGVVCGVTGGALCLAAIVRARAYFHSI